MSVTTKSYQFGPPYVGFQTFINTLDWLERDSLPQRFDKSIWGSKLSAVYSSQMMATYRALGLLEEGDSPTEILVQLVFNRSERKSILRQVLRASYGPVFELNLARATASQLDNAFTKLGVQGDTARKAIAFFTHAATFCDIELSPFFVKGRKGKAVVRRSGTADRPHARNPALRSDEIHPTLLPLLVQMRQDGPTWTQDERERWLTAWRAMVEFVYPSVPRR